jgi:four helix bundle protein
MFTNARSSFAVVVAQIISELAGGNASLTDQLRHAATSVPVHVAEGVECSSAADRRYAITRGSAMECAAILDACRVLQLASPDLLAAGRSLLLRVVQC